MNIVSDTVARPASKLAHRGLHNHVVLLRTRHFTVVNFGVFAAVGAALAGWLTLAWQIRLGLAPERYVAALFLAVPALILVGSRGLVLVQEWRSFVASPWQTLRRPGFAFQGGFIAVVAGLMVIVVAHGLPCLTFLDTFALTLPLGHALGRLGCLTYGCCHGRPTDSHLGIRYTNPESKVFWGSDLGGVRIHPTQAYSAAGNLTLFLLLNAMMLMPLVPGQLTATYLVLGACGRFIIEFWRGIPVRQWLGLSTYQWVAVGILAVGLALAAIVAFGAGGTALAHPVGLGVAMGASLVYAPYILFFAFTIFVAFGIHGHKVGQL